jgi:hypothetical protein
MARSICCWPKNSVGDILDMIMQALEVRRRTSYVSAIQTIFRESLSFMNDLSPTGYSAIHPHRITAHSLIAVT